jgi:LPXTG-motif cell wall-anchored protein
LNTIAFTLKAIQNIGNKAYYALKITNKIREEIKMFKKLASLVLAATMLVGTTAVVASAAEAEEVAVAADSSSEVSADSSSEVGASKVFYFDVKSAGWNVGTDVFCHIYSVTGDDEKYTGWQSKAEKCKVDKETGIATYDIQTGIKKGATGLNTINGDNKWAVIFSSKTGAETYAVLLNSNCYGDTAIADPNTMLENNVDSEKSSMKLSWKKNTNLGAPYCITSTGKVQGSSYAYGESAESVTANFLTEYYGSEYCTDEAVKNAFNTLGADPNATLSGVAYNVEKKVAAGTITKEAGDKLVKDVTAQVKKIFPDKEIEEDVKPVKPAAPAGNGGSSNSGSNGSSNSSNNGGSNGSSNGSVSSGQETTVFYVFAGLMLLAAGTMFLARKKREE